VWGQRSKDGLNVNLRATGDTYADISDVETNKFIDEIDHLFSWRSNIRPERTLVDCIQNDIGGALLIEGKHLLETHYHSAIIRFPYSTIVRRIETGEDVTTGIGPSRELDEEGRKEVLEFLLVDVLEVEIEIRHRGPPGVVQGHNILYDRGAEYTV